jgi:ligand-binding sensor domain-containing protein
LKSLLTFVILLFGNWVYTQSLNLSFNHLTREGGLSNNNATDMFSDSKGFLWIGTQNGLNRFDGSVCKVYKLNNSTRSGSYIAFIKEDKNADLWFASETGLNHYSRLNDSFENIDCIKDGKLRQHLPFYVDNLNRIWLYIVEKGVFVYNPKNKSSKFITNTFSNYVKVNNLSFQEVKQIFYSESQFGLTRLTIKNDKVINAQHFFDGKKQPKISLARYFFVENDSLVWLTNNELGLIKFNYQTLHYQPFGTFQNQKIVSLTSVAFRPNSSQVFVGSTFSGILIFDKIQAKFIKQITPNPINSKSIPARWVEDILIDQNQNLFVSLMGWGIDFTNLNGSNTQHWLNKDDVEKYKLENNIIDLFWVQKDKIFVRLRSDDEAKRTMILNSEGEIIKRIKGFPVVEGCSYDTDSTLLVFGFGSIFRVDNDFNVKDKIVINPSKEQIFAVLAISEQEWLVLAESHFYKVLKKQGNYRVSELEEFRNYIHTNSRPAYYDVITQQLFISSNWWSSFNCFKKNKGKWELQPMKKIEAGVLNIVPDLKDKNILWLCTNKGLWKFDVRNYQYEVWDESQGLPDNAVTTYIPNQNGDFWLITNRGISFYDKKLNSFKNYTSKDGATSTEYAWWGIFKLSNGRMIFPGMNGITMIEPNRFQKIIPPKLYITDLKVNEKSLNSETYIGEASFTNLQPNESSFSLEFVGIDFANPENIKLQYQLQGFDNEWITIKNPANVYFSNVPEGDYYFKIRSLSDNGEMTAEKSLKVIIAAPFWRTWWFRLLMFAVFVGIAYSFYRYRINELLKLQAVRNRISTDLHDEIGATLSGIGILSTIAKKQVDKSHPAYLLLGRITDDALSVGNAIDDIVWSINPKNDDLSNIIARMRRYASELFDAKNIDYQIVMPQEVEDVKMTMEQRRDVYLIFKEAINNLLKYAACTQVRIEINIENRKFNLVITDNGKGFDTTKPSARNGIKNMKNRAEKLHGKFLLNSKEGHGTKVDLEFLI